MENRMGEWGVNDMEKTVNSIGLGIVRSIQKYSNALVKLGDILFRFLVDYMEFRTGQLMYIFLISEKSSMFWNKLHNGSVNCESIKRPISHMIK